MRISPLFPLLFATLGCDSGIMRFRRLKSRIHRIALFTATAVLLVGCDTGSTRFTSLATVEPDIVKDATTLGVDVRGKGYAGSPDNHQWHISFTAEEESAVKLFEQHKARIVEALNSEGAHFSGPGTGGYAYTQHFNITYSAPSGSAVVRCFLVENPEDNWTIIQIVHESSGTD